MKPGSDLDPEKLDELVLRCLDEMETEGDLAVDRACGQNPAYATALRERLRVLREGGLLEGESPTKGLDHVPDRLGAPA